MKGKKDLLAKFLYGTGLFSLLNYGRSKHLFVINYHRIRADHNEKYNFFDDGVFGPTRTELNSHFQWLKQNVDVISEDDLINIACGSIPPPSRGVLITFDDGYKDNYSIAYPLLRAHGLSAIFFIPTQAVEERTLGWWDIVAYLIKMTENEKIIFEDKKIFPKTNTQQSIRYILNIIYQNRRDVEKLLLELSKRCEVNLPDLDIQSKELMTWDDLREVTKHGICIGAHTHSHKILSSLDLATQEYEMVRSKRIVEKRLNLKVRSMSYPVGTYRCFSDDTKRLALNAGYDIAFSFLTGVNLWKGLDRMDIKRIGISYNLPRFVGTFYFPSLFCEMAID